MRVLFNTEVDAIDSRGGGEHEATMHKPVEVKNNRFDNLGLKEALQLFSSGAKTLITADVEDRREGSTVKFDRDGQTKFVQAGPPNKYLTGVHTHDVNELFSRLPRTRTEAEVQAAKKADAQAQPAGQQGKQGFHPRGGRFNTMDISVQEAVGRIRRALTKIKWTMETRTFPVLDDRAPSGSLYEIVFEHPGLSEEFSLNYRATNDVKQVYSELPGCPL